MTSASTSSCSSKCLSLINQRFLCEILKFIQFEICNWRLFAFYADKYLSVNLHLIYFVYIFTVKVLVAPLESNSLYIIMICVLLLYIVF